MDCIKYNENLDKKLMKASKMKGILKRKLKSRVNETNWSEIIEGFKETYQNTEKWDILLLMALISKKTNSDTIYIDEAWGIWRSYCENIGRVRDSYFGFKNMIDSISGYCDIVKELEKDIYWLIAPADEIIKLDRNDILIEIINNIDMIMNPKDDRLLNDKLKRKLKKRKSIINRRSKIVQYTRGTDYELIEFIELCERNGIILCKREQDGDIEGFNPISSRELDNILYKAMGLIMIGVHMDKNGELDEKSKIRLKEIVEKMKQDKLKSKGE